VLRNIGELVTIAGHSGKPVRHPTVETLGILRKEGTCIASCAGKIDFVGASSDVSDHVSTTRATEIDCKGKLVIPGFVDSHTHAVFAGSREEELEYKLSGLSYLDILRKGGGILKTVKETREASTETILKQTSSRLDRMMSYGTTTFEVKSGYGLSVDSEIRLLEILSELQRREKYDLEPTLLAAHALPPEYTKRARDYIDEVVYRAISVARKRRLAKFCDVFLEAGVFGRDEAKRVLEYARAQGFALKIHADEFSNLEGASLGAAVKVVSADHLLHSSMYGINALSRSGAVCTLLPGTALSSFSKYANARGMVDSGAPVALATDLSPNSWIESMQLVLSLACFGMRMTPAEAIVAATINGAHAISRGEDVGSIEISKKSDLVLFDLSSHEEIPYRIGSNNAMTVVKRGKVVRETQS
jgi:imidazolonepropionase